MEVLNGATPALLWPIHMTPEGEIVCTECDTRNPYWNQSLIAVDLNRFSAEILRQAVTKHRDTYHG
jgi:hypothetical protein